MCCLISHCTYGISTLQVSSRKDPLCLLFFQAFFQLRRCCYVNVLALGNFNLFMHIDPWLYKKFNTRTLNDITMYKLS